MFDAASAVAVTGGMGASHGVTGRCCRRRCTWHNETEANGGLSRRRSSLAVVATGGMSMRGCCGCTCGAKAERLNPQSRSAVHYLAISPPRIRVTQAHDGHQRHQRHKGYVEERHDAYLRDLEALLRRGDEGGTDEAEPEEKAAHQQSASEEAHAVAAGSRRSSSDSSKRSHWSSNRSR
jgi:hypothetical protein